MAGSQRPAPTPSHDSPGSDSPSESGGREAHSQEPGAQPAGGNGASPASGGLIQILAQFVEDVIGSANGLIEIYADRMRLSVRRTIVQVAIGIAAAVCAVVWLGAASLATFRGVCGGLTSLWGGREWLGDLTGGLLALTLTAIAVAIHLRLSTRREISRLKAKYERIRHEHSKNQNITSPSGNGK